MTQHKNACSVLTGLHSVIKLLHLKKKKISFSLGLFLSSRPGGNIQDYLNWFKTFSRNFSLLRVCCWYIWISSSTPEQLIESNCGPRVILVLCTHLSPTSVCSFCGGSMSWLSASILKVNFYHSVNSKTEHMSRAGYGCLLFTWSNCKYRTCFQGPIVLNDHSENWNTIRKLMQMLYHCQGYDNKLNARKLSFINTCPVPWFVDKLQQCCKWRLS